MSYPTSIPTFTDLVDDVDYILAADQNDPNDVITSIATMLGAVGAAQSYSTDILDHLANKQAPILTKASASSLSVGVGAVVVKNSAQSKRYLKRNTAAVTVTSANIDTGAMAVGYYYVYAIGDAAATTFTIVFSTSATNPAVGAGLIYALIGWFYNESGGALDVTSGFVGGIKDNGRDVPNACHLMGYTSDTINDTSYGSDITQMVIRMFVSGRPLFINFHGYFDGSVGGQAMNNGLQVIVDIDGSDDTDSESASTDAGAAGGEPNSVHINYLKLGLARGVHTFTIQGKVQAGSDVLTKKEFDIIEL